jgi:hypothetical protein
MIAFGSGGLCRKICGSPYLLKTGILAEHMPKRTVPPRAAQKTDCAAQAWNEADYETEETDWKIDSFSNEYRPS